MKIKKRYITVIAAFILMVAAFFSENAFAVATASMSGGGNYKVGQTVTIKFTYSGASYGTAKVIFKYDTSVLQFKSCSGTYGGTSGVTTVSLASGGSNTLGCTLTFKAVGTGSTSVTAETEELYDIDENNILSSVSTKSTTVSVSNPSAQVSSNANLSSLSVSAGSLSPSFSPSVTSYTVNVGSDVSVCTISAKTQNSKATISVSGSKNLKAGKNVRSVTVTAENGSTKTYTITIYKAEGTTGGNDKEDPDLPDEQPGTPEEIKITLGGKEYTLDENISANNVPGDFTITSAMYGQQEIPVIKDSQLKYTFALLKDDETGDSTWFFFDEENDIFSSSVEISSEDAMKYAQLVTAEDKNGSQPSGIGMTEKILYIALCFTVAALTLTVAVMKIKRKKRDKR
ncbi:MAG: cadherin-like beta sandwich domain-containing protein [Anaerovoracaceae bacterium]